MDTDTDEVVRIVLASLLHTDKTARTPSATRTSQLLNDDTTLEDLRDNDERTLGLSLLSLVGIAIDLRHLDLDVAVLHLRATRNLHVELAFATNSNGIGQSDMLLSLSLAIDSDHIVEVADGLLTVVEERHREVDIGIHGTRGATEVRRSNIVIGEVTLHEKLNTHILVLAVEAIPAKTLTTLLRGDVAIQPELVVLSVTLAHHRDRVAFVLVSATARRVELLIVEADEEARSVFDGDRLIERHLIPALIGGSNILCEELVTDANIVESTSSRVDEDARIVQSSAETETHTDDLLAHIVRHHLRRKVGCALVIARVVGDTNTILAQSIRRIEAGPTLVGGNLGNLLCTSILDSRRTY